MPSRRRDSCKNGPTTLGVMIQKLLPPTNVRDLVEAWQFKLKEDHVRSGGSG